MQVRGRFGGFAVEGQDFIALMEGRHPRTGGWLRPEGAGGGRGGGIDLTFSAPKSVSAVWALGGESQRRDMEAAAIDRKTGQVGRIDRAGTRRGHRSDRERAGGSRFPARADE